MDKIKDVLKAVLRDLTKKQQGKNVDEAQAAWERIVGPQAAAHSRIAYLTKDKIRVNVNSSAYLYELNLNRERITKAIYKALKIKDVKFRMGDVREEHGRRQ